MKSDKYNGIVPKVKPKASFTNVEDLDFENGIVPTKDQKRIETVDFDEPDYEKSNGIVPTKGVKGINAKSDSEGIGQVSLYDGPNNDIRYWDGKDDEDTYKKLDKLSKKLKEQIDGDSDDVSKLILEHYNDNGEDKSGYIAFLAGSSESDIESSRQNLLSEMALKENEDPVSNTESEKSEDEVFVGNESPYADVKEDLDNSANEQGIDLDADSNLHNKDAEKDYSDETDKNDKNYSDNNDGEPQGSLFSEDNPFSGFDQQNFEDTNNLGEELPIVDNTVGEELAASFFDEGDVDPVIGDAQEAESEKSTNSTLDPYEDNLKSQQQNLVTSNLNLDDEGKTDSFLFDEDAGNELNKTAGDFEDETFGNGNKKVDETGEDFLTFMSESSDNDIIDFSEGEKESDGDDKNELPGYEDNSNVPLSSEEEEMFLLESKKSKSKSKKKEVSKLKDVRAKKLKKYKNLKKSYLNQSTNNNLLEFNVFDDEMKPNANDTLKDLGMDDNTMSPEQYLLNTLKEAYVINKQIKEMEDLSGMNEEEFKKYSEELPNEYDNVEYSNSLMGECGCDLDKDYEQNEENSEDNNESKDETNPDEVETEVIADYILNEAKKIKKIVKNKKSKKSSKKMKEEEEFSLFSEDNDLGDPNLDDTATDPDFEDNDFQDNTKDPLGVDPDQQDLNNDDTAGFLAESASIFNDSYKSEESAINHLVSNISIFEDNK